MHASSGQHKVMTALKEYLMWVTQPQEVRDNFMAITNRDLCAVWLRETGPETAKLNCCSSSKVV